MKLAAALVLALGTAACANSGNPSTAIRCDDNGEIVIQQDTPPDLRAAWLIRNVDLETRRGKRMRGETPWATPQSLAKAEGCP